MHFLCRRFKVWPQLAQSLTIQPGRIIFSFDSSCCGWLILPIGCSKFKLSSISIGVPRDYTPRLGGKFLFHISIGKFLFHISIGKFSSNSSSSFESSTWKLKSTKNHFQNNMSRICAPPNSTSLVMLDLWGLPKAHNLLWNLLNMMQAQLICIAISTNATKIMSFFTT